jgi:putative transposase
VWRLHGTGFPSTSSVTQHSLVLNLKMERVWQRQYANHAEARTDVTDYIVSFYNCKRINSTLGNLSPTAYERKMAALEPIGASEIT